MPIAATIDRRPDLVLYRRRHPAPQARLARQRPSKTVIEVPSNTEIALRGWAGGGMESLKLLGAGEIGLPLGRVGALEDGGLDGRVGRGRSSGAPTRPCGQSVDIQLSGSAERGSTGAMSSAELLGQPGTGPRGLTVGRSSSQENIDTLLL
jgi:hypothetical protein